MENNDKLIEEFFFTLRKEFRIDTADIPMKLCVKIIKEALDRNNLVLVEKVK